LASRPARTWFLPAVIAGQIICALFFVGGILSSMLGLPPIAWELFEVIELLAAAGLIIGIVMGIIALRQGQARIARAEAQLRVASGAFLELLEERFADWGLTPAERDVALFAIKGLSTADIAVLRETSEGTVKAQTNAIYRKAGVSGRPQLLSLFIEDLMDGPVTLTQRGKRIDGGAKPDNPVA
jgi:DNA-binding CsgD family transcriptional regulator